MKFSIFNGVRQEAQPGASGQCPACGQAMIAKCGKIKIWHWAHKGRRTCDPWWENETEWHREWKNCFDAKWQEVVHKDESADEIHIADVTTPHGWTIEIQHSPMGEAERMARNSFYKKIVWVVDGTKRKSDIAQLSRLLSSGIQLNTKFPTFAIDPNHKNRLLAEWHNKDSLVFFDFKQTDRQGQRVIWFALPKLRVEDAYVPAFANDLFIQAFPASWFIETHINGVFDQFFTLEIYSHVLQYCKALFNIRTRYKIERFPDPRLSWLIA